MITHRSFKIPAGEYYEYSPEQGKNIYFIQGARGVGKSYSIKNWVRDNVVKKGKKFMYVRSEQNELATAISWVDEMDLSVGGSPFTVARGVPYAGCLSLVELDDEGRKTGRVDHIGYTISLESSALIKSAVFNDVDAIIYEEYVRQGFNEAKEWRSTVAFIELLETVARGRDIKVFLISNMLKTVPMLEEAFAKSDNAVVYKIFSRRAKDSGILAGVSPRFAKYLQGEYLDAGYADFTDLEPIMRVGDGTLYVHKYNASLGFNLVKDKTVNRKMEHKMKLRRALANWEKSDWVFKDAKSEKYFRDSNDRIRNEVRKLFDKTILS